MVITGLLKGEIMSIWMDRENAIVNSVMSGLNSCGTLQKMVAEAAAGNPQPLENHIRCGVRATLAVCADEATQLRIDRDKISQQEEAKRQALEYISSNAQSASAAHIHAYAEKALGRIK